MYDAYVSYSVKDEHFVTQVLSSELEHGEPSYRVCLHYADLPQATFVADTICEATHNSRRTIIVLSNNYILHEWSRYDVRSALHDILKSRGRAVILVLGDVNNRDLDPDLRHYMKTNTTIHWSDRLFWDKLRFYLPTVSPSLCSSGSGSGRSSVPVHYTSNYCHPIYEVPRYPGLSGVSNTLGHYSSTNGNGATLASNGHHGHTLHHGQLVSGHLGQHVVHHNGHSGLNGQHINNIYESNTLDSQLTAKIY